MDTKAALKLIGITRNTYNSWCQQANFVELYRKREEFSNDYKQEALQLLRRDNQLEAVLLEGKIIATLKKEIESEEYNLIRSQLAREVYSKLINELDVVPQTQLVSWEQRIGQIINNPTPQITEGEVIEGEIVGV